MTTAVMARRVEPPNSLDFFPTPPWATRALFECALGVGNWESAWEPAAGEGHMAEVLREYFPSVIASDVHDYGKGYAIGSYVGEGLDVAPRESVDWVISNPPFNKAVEFVQRAIDEARIGVAMLLRTSWLEGGGRYADVFSIKPPSMVAVFCERVPMVKGRWDPVASSATSYAWFVWSREHDAGTRLVWIPPGQRDRLSKQSDIKRFCEPEAGTMLDIMEAAE